MCLNKLKKCDALIQQWAKICLGCRPPERLGFVKQADGRGRGLTLNLHTCAYLY